MEAPQIALDSCGHVCMCARVPVCVGINFGRLLASFQAQQDLMVSSFCSLLSTHEQMWPSILGARPGAASFLLRPCCALAHGSSAGALSSNIISEILPRHPALSL